MCLTDVMAPFAQPGWVQPRLFQGFDLRKMLKTPYYLIDKSKLLPNMEKIAKLRDMSGAKSLLALKCFATWSVFDLMSEYMDGTTSSSLYEVQARP